MNRASRESRILALEQSKVPKQKPIYEAFLFDLEAGEGPGYLYETEGPSVIYREWRLDPPSETLDNA